MRKLAGKKDESSRFVVGRSAAVTAILLAMLVIFGVVAATAGVVVLGIEGRGRLRAPRLADRLARAAERLNGDGQL